MSQLLQINSSVFGDQGVSSQLANAFVQEWKRKDPGAHVTHRDLVVDAIPHLDGERLTALMTSEAERTPEQQQVVEQSDALIRELQEADLVVIGAPMYNFGIPSQLKSWLDMVARSGITFRYTEQGPEGLLTGKKVYVFASSGGIHRGGHSDGVTPYLETMLGFLGMTDVEFIYAEGLAMGEEPRARGIAQANARIDALLAA
ncbi:MAG: FMN-dependent NADH-azoreductase [Ectothiorhodospiraceae bacterium]|nr:FMN-dependent NADH-azoreductase [Ectothiorhodospiraceae bacterium]